MWQINTFIPYLRSPCPIRRQHFLHGTPPAVKGYLKYGIHAPERPSLRVAYHRIQYPIRAGNPAKLAVHEGTVVVTGEEMLTAAIYQF